MKELKLVPGKITKREQTTRNNLMKFLNSKDWKENSARFLKKNLEVWEDYVAKATALVPTQDAGMTESLDPLLRKRANTFRPTNRESMLPTDPFWKNHSRTHSRQK